MITRFWRAGPIGMALVALWTVGCEQSKSNNRVDDGKASRKCTYDDDCLVDCSAMCPNPCRPCSTAIHRNQRKAPTEADLKERLDRAYRCPKRDCHMRLPQHSIARCVDGKCFAKIVHSVRLPQGCESDNECVLSCRLPGECCDDPCKPCERAYNRKALRKIIEWRLEYCAKDEGTPSDCPRKRCVESRQKLVARCMPHPPEDPLGPEGHCKAVVVKTR